MTCLFSVFVVLEPRPDTEEKVDNQHTDDETEDQGVLPNCHKQISIINWINLLRRHRESGGEYGEVITRAGYIVTF